LARSWLQLQTNALAVYQPAGQVVVAAEPLAYGAMVMSESVVGIPWYANTLPEGAFASKDDLHQGGRRTVLYPLKRGEPVLRSRVTGAGQRASLAALLEDGKRAVTVRVDDVRGVAGFVLPGDFVDLVMIADEPSSKRQSYRPAQNVRKGYVLATSDDGANACTARRGANWPIGSPPDQVTGLPLDRTWPYFGSMGEGNWDFGTYWQVNHGDSSPPTNLDEGSADNSNVPSRYRVYRYEIDHGHVGDISFGGESGAPACYTGNGELSAVPDRRIVHAAIVNCQSLQLVGEAQSDIPVAAFGKFFLTLPLARSQTDLYVELVGLVRPGDGVSYDVAQLYR
jgi:hypothetical protein